MVGGQSTLYLSGKNYSDGWALAVSTDEGVTVTPVMSYDQVAGIKPCVQQLCLDTCNYEEMQAIWDTAVCAGADGGASDGGTGPTAELGMSLRRGRRRPVASGGAGLAGLSAGGGRRGHPPPAPARPRAAGLRVTLAFRRSFASTVEDPQCRFPPFFVHGVSVQGWAHSSAVRAGGS